MATNGKQVGITKIEAFKDGGLGPIGGTDVAKITYTPELDILKADFLTITGTDCSPSIDGTDLPVYKVVSKTEVWVAKKLTSGGSKGSITLKTTPSARLGEAVGAGAGAAAGAAGSAAGGLLGGLADSLGISSDYITYIIAAVVILCIISLVMKFAK